MVELGVVADGGEEVEDLAVVCGGVADAVGGEHRQLQRTCDAKRRLVAPLFLALAVPLQFDVDILAAEDARRAVRLSRGLPLRRR